MVELIEEKEFDKNKNKAKNSDRKSGSLKEFKETYEELRKVHNLPDFRYLNENFELESLSGEETDLLIRKIRKQIVERIYYNTRALETFLNPQNAPMFIFNIIKGFSEAEQEHIRDLYNKLAEFEIEAFGLEIEYNEKKEVEFIKKIHSFWPFFTEGMKRIYDSMKSNYKQESKKQSKSYLG